MRKGKGNILLVPENLVRCAAEREPQRRTGFFDLGLLSSVVFRENEPSTCRSHIGKREQVQRRRRGGVTGNSRPVIRTSKRLKKGYGSSPKKVARGNQDMEALENYNRRR